MASAIVPCRFKNSLSAQFPSVFNDDRDELLQQVVAQTHSAADLWAAVGFVALALMHTRNACLNQPELPVYRTQGGALETSIAIELLPATTRNPALLGAGYAPVNAIYSSEICPSIVEAIQRRAYRPASEKRRGI